MILELLGKLCDAESLADSDTYAGYCLDLGNATHELPGAADIWIALSTNVAASIADGDEYYQFQIRTGSGSDGTDINAGAKTIIETPSIIGSDARLATVGAWILRCTLPMECRSYDTQRYLQLYYAQAGTTNTITIDFELSPSRPRTDYNIQVESSNVGTP
jgi:hypothetical protein